MRYRITMAVLAGLAFMSLLLFGLEATPMHSGARTLLQLFIGSIVLMGVLMGRHHKKHEAYMTPRVREKSEELVAMLGACAGFGALFLVGEYKQHVAPYSWQHLVVAIPSLIFITYYIGTSLGRVKKEMLGT